MEDVKRTLEGIRDMARSRVQTLNEGDTLYTDAQRALYLREYESKLRELDELLDDLTSAAASSRAEVKPDTASPVKRYWRRLCEVSRKRDPDGKRPQ